MDDQHHDQQMTMASGQLPVQHSQHSRMQPWADPDRALQAASADDFMRELSSCLALVAASGMSDQARTEWLITARATLNGIPADLLARGAAVARKYCDHPSKVVATIMREVETSWENRKRAALGQPVDRPAYPTGPRPIAEVVTPEQIEEIKAEFGLSTSPYPEKRKPTGVVQKMPTREDYIALGVSAEVLDRITDQRGQAA